MDHINGENLFRDTEMFFTGEPGDNTEEFAKMMGLEGTYWKWLVESNNVSTIDEQLNNIRMNEESLRSLTNTINDLADQAAIENYASRRVLITIDEDRHLAVKIAIHPHTQQKIIEFIIEHLRTCTDKECDLILDAKELVDDGYSVLPKMVKANIWTDKERMAVIGLLDQLDATIHEQR